MKPLVTNQLVLTWLCVFPANEETSKWKKLAYVTLTFVTIVSMMCAIVGSVAFLMEYASADLKLALYTLYPITAGGSMLYACIIVFFKRHRMPIIFEKLANIYQSSKNPFTF